MRAAEAWMVSYALNALWQVPLIAVTAWLAARLLRQGGPGTEHRVWVVALAVQVALPACALPGLYPVLCGVLGRAWVLFRHGPGGNASVSAATDAGGVVHATSWNGMVLHGLAIVYGAAFMLLAMRLLWRITHLRTLRQTVVVRPLTGGNVADWQVCCTVFKLPAVCVGESAAVRAPLTLGWRRVYLLLPPGMAAAVPRNQIFAALAHEAAHIHRQDYAKNLLYELLALPVAWHPALWFARAHLHESREMVCDSMAANVTGSRAQFAESLVRLALLFVSPCPATVPHAIGIFGAHTLERRIDMLTTEKAGIGRVQRLATVVMCTVLFFGSCATALALRIQAQAQAPSAGTATNPVRVSGSVAAGQSITKVAPKYPQDAKAAKVQGVVILRTIINENGTVQSTSAISGPQELRQSAMDAVKQWVYKPYLLNGKPVAVDTTVTVTYSLQP